MFFGLEELRRFLLDNPDRIKEVEALLKEVKLQLKTEEEQRNTIVPFLSDEEYEKAVREEKLPTESQLKSIGKTLREWYRETLFANAPRRNITSTWAVNHLSRDDVYPRRLAKMTINDFKKVRNISQDSAKDIRKRLRRHLGLEE